MGVELLTELQFFATNLLDILKGLWYFLCQRFIWFVVIISRSHWYFPCRFAYIEFTDKDSVETAVTMDDSLFKGRQIKVHYAIVYSSFNAYFQE